MGYRCRSEAPEKAPFAPYLPYLRAKVWKAESQYWRGSSIPSIPSTPRPAHVRRRACAYGRARTCVRAHAAANVYQTGMEGMEGMEDRVSARAPAFHTSRRGMEQVWNPERLR